jgi:hypothetical protein
MAHLGVAALGAAIAITVEALLAISLTWIGITLGSIALVYSIVSMVARE